MKKLVKTASAIKYYYGMNLYGERDKINNNRNKLSECTRCSQTKD